jgi:hypothetical protein
VLLALAFCNAEVDEGFVLAGLSKPDRRAKQLQPGWNGISGVARRQPVHRLFGGGWKKRENELNRTLARVAELADALDSKSSVH